MRRLPADWTLPEAPPAADRAPANDAEAPAWVEYRWAGDDARLTGDLVHRLLQVIAEGGADGWTADGGMKSREAWCREQLLSAGIRGGRADAVIDRTQAAIDACLASERGRWIIADHPEATCEHAVTAVLDDAPVSMKLDRTFVDKDERWIIDYKTSVHAGGDLDAFLASEAERYRPQLERYRDAMALTDSRRIRMALYFPLLDRFEEL